MNDSSDNLTTADLAGRDGHDDPDRSARLDTDPPTGPAGVAGDLTNPAPDAAHDERPATDRDLTGPTGTDHDRDATGPAGTDHDRNAVGATRADHDRDTAGPAGAGHDRVADDTDHGPAAGSYADHIGLDRTGDRPEDSGPDPVRADVPPAAPSTVGAPGAESTVDAPAAGSTAQSTTGPLLGSTDSEGFRARWTDVQTGFVDAPREAVQKADALVAELMQHLAGSFADERGKLEHQWDRGDDVPTDDLRDAFQRYRSFFERLLAT